MDDLDKILDETVRIIMEAANVSEYFALLIIQSKDPLQLEFSQWVIQKGVSGLNAE